MVDQFRQFLLRSTPRISPVSIKNYVADVNQFLHWYKQTYQHFSPMRATMRQVDRYLAEKKVSELSKQRHRSSLKRFFTFLQVSHYTTENIFAKPEQQDVWHIKDFQYYLQVYNSSENTIKYYSLDVKQFLRWMVKKVSGTVEASTEAAVLGCISPEDLIEYRKYLQEQDASAGAITRKYSAVRKYVRWLEHEGLLAPNYALDK